MTKPIRVSERFGRLSVIEKVGRKYRCICDCGTIKEIRISDIKRGKSKSCGCLRAEIASCKKITHGLYNHPLYKVWKGIKARCYIKSASNYENYGGRGIEIYKEWRENFKPFYRWCILHGWKLGLEIDRIDNDKGYNPLNCRFVTSRENVLNSRLIKKNNTTGYCGVSYNKRNKNFRAYISVKGKRIGLGSYKYSRIACLARDQYIIDNNLQNEYKLQIKSEAIFERSGE